MPSAESRPSRRPIASWLLAIGAWLLLVAILGDWNALPVGHKGEGLLVILVGWILIRIGSAIVRRIRRPRSGRE